MTSRNRTVVGVRLEPESADVTLEFEGDRRLELISNSAGYEPWEFTAPDVHVVGLGGEGVADFSRRH